MMYEWTGREEGINLIPLHTQDAVHALTVLSKHINNNNNRNYTDILLFLADATAQYLQATSELLVQTGSDDGAIQHHPTHVTWTIEQLNAHYANAISQYINLNININNKQQDAYSINDLGNDTINHILQFCAIDDHILHNLYVNKTFHNISQKIIWNNVKLQIRNKPQAHITASVLDLFALQITADEPRLELIENILIDLCCTQHNESLIEASRQMKQLKECSIVYSRNVSCDEETFQEWIPTLISSSEKLETFCIWVDERTLWNLCSPGNKFENALSSSSITGFILHVVSNLHNTEGYQDMMRTSNCVQRWCSSLPKNLRKLDIHCEDDDHDFAVPFDLNIIDFSKLESLFLEFLVVDHSLLSSILKNLKNCAELGLVDLEFREGHDLSLVDICKSPCAVRLEKFTISTEDRWENIQENLPLLENVKEASIYANCESRGVYKTVNKLLPNVKTLSFSFDVDNLPFQTEEELVEFCEEVLPTNPLIEDLTFDWHGDTFRAPVVPKVHWELRDKFFSNRFRMVERLSKLMPQLNEFRFDSVDTVHDLYSHSFNLELILGKRLKKSQHLVSVRPCATPDPYCCVYPRKRKRVLEVYDVTE